MAKETVPVFVSYEEAQALIPIFEYYARDGQWKEVRADARIILKELRDVRDVNYGQLPGRQIFLEDDQADFFMRVRREARD